MRLPFSHTRIYLDYASATPVSKEAQRAVSNAEKFSGNPGGIHQEAQAAAASLQHSRERIAAELACKPREIIFTSGLTEANNLAILGLAQHLEREGKSLTGTHWIVSGIEHPSVLECFAEIERRGGTVSHVDPEANGVIKAEKVRRMLRPETILVSIGWANSEIGTMQPLREIASIIRAHDKSGLSSGKGSILFHSDAGQAPLYRAPNVHTLGVDLFSLGSGKLYGPRGIGALYIGKRASPAPLIIGGGQERGLRAGTESVALAAGFAEAMRTAGSTREREGKRVRALRDELAKALAKDIAGIVINGDLKYALPHMLNISIPNINSEYLVLALDRAGIALSTKAACSEGNRNESPVVAALRGEAWRAKNTLRISLGRGTSAADIKRACQIIIRMYGEVAKLQL